MIDINTLGRAKINGFLEDANFTSSFYDGFLEALDIRDFNIARQFWEKTGNPQHFYEGYLSKCNIIAWGQVRPLLEHFDMELANYLLDTLESIPVDADKFELFVRLLLCKKFNYINYDLVKSLRCLGIEDMGSLGYILKHLSHGKLDDLFFKPLNQLEFFSKARNLLFNERYTSAQIIYEEASISYSFDDFKDWYSSLPYNSFIVKLLFAIERERTGAILNLNLSEPELKEYVLTLARENGDSLLNYADYNSWFLCEPRNYAKVRRLIKEGEFNAI